jgi:oligopeptidase A
MADLETASKLLEDLRVASFVAGKKELEDTQKFAQAQGFEGKLMNWDVNFWSERMKEDLFDISDEMLRPYFALPRVLDGLFRVRIRSKCW